MRVGLYRERKTLKDLRRSRGRGVEAFRIDGRNVQAGSMRAKKVALWLRRQQAKLAHRVLKRLQSLA